jgi:hypothetical protein
MRNDSFPKETERKMDQESNEGCDCERDPENLENEASDLVITTESVTTNTKEQRSPPELGKSPDHQSNRSDSNPSETTVTPLKVFDQDAQVLQRHFSSTTTSFRERTTTSGSDHGGLGRKFGSGGQKRQLIHHQSSLVEDKYYYNFSSNESLGPTVGRNKIIPEISSPAPSKEVRFIRLTRGQNFQDERLVLVSPKHIPFLVFSTLPYNKGYRSNR